MILAIHTHKGADYYLLRNDEEVQRLRKELAEDYWDGTTWTKVHPSLSLEQIDQHWQYKSELALEWFETTSLTYHYEKP